MQNHPSPENIQHSSSTHSCASSSLSHHPPFSEQLSADNCSENGGWCDSEEEAQEWVEDECWIFSGEGWFCIECNSHYMRNLSQTRRDKGLDKLLPDGWDDDLEVGINTVR